MREVWTSYKRWMLDDKGYASTTRGTYLGYAHSAHRWLRSNGHTGLPWATDVSIRAYWDTTAPTAESRMHVRAALCAFFACINDLGWRPDNPAASLPKLKRPKRLPRPIMGSDAQKVLDVAQAFDGDAAARDVVLLRVGGAAADQRFGQVGQVRHEDRHSG